MFLKVRRRNERQLSHGLSADERRFVEGTRGVADVIAPAAIEVSPHYLRLDSQFLRTLSVTGYPRTVGPGWLSPLIDFEEPIELSLHIHPLETASMIRMLTHKLVQLRSSQIWAVRHERESDGEREVAYGDAERLRDALQRGDEKIFSVSLYILLRANSQAALDQLTRRVETTLNGLLAHSRVAVLEQDNGFRSCLPLARDALLVYHNLDTSSLATMFPFSSGGLSMPEGVLYGIAMDNQTPLIFDPFHDSLENANQVIFAKSGAGKSYFTKLAAMRNLMVGTDVIVIDPEDEYRAICAALKDEAQYIRLASSSAQHLNPFDLPPGDAGDIENEARSAVEEQVEAVLGLLQVMLAEPGRSLNTYERAVLDRAIYQAYEAEGITEDPNTHTRPAPLLKDLHAALKDTPGDVAESLTTRLARYVTGSLSGLFKGPTNVELERRLVVFNVQALEAELRPLAIHLISNFVWTRIRRQRKPRLLIIDEAWTLMQYSEGGAFLAEMARRARKYFLGLVTITQDVADFLNSDNGRTVLSNAAIKLLLKQDSATIDPVVRAFQLSETERQFLLGAEKGQGLFFARGTHVPMRVEAAPYEHRWATTAPAELAAMAALTQQKAPVLSLVGTKGGNSQ